MIDFIKATTSFEGKDIKILTHLLEFVAQYSSGWQKYWLEGCNKLSVWIHPGLQLLRIEGSVAYYWQGHNFSFGKRDFVDAVQHIGNVLGISIWNAILDCFEYGVIIEVEEPPKQYIKYHSADPKSKLLTNEKPEDKGKFKWFSDKLVKLKMYDAGFNILIKQGLNQRDAIRASGWDEDCYYLKWEAHYLKPECLNRGVGLRLANLANPDWQDIFKEDLYLQYKRLIPMKCIITPSTKKELSTADILVLAMVEESVNRGGTIDELKKMLYSRINSIPEEVLTKSDKDLRKAQIRKLLGKIKESDESIYDLSDKIQKALNEE